MIPGQMSQPPMQPHAPGAGGGSPLAALFARHAASMGPAMGGGHGGMPQAPGAPMALNAGGHAAARSGHMPVASY